MLIDGNVQHTDPPRFALSKRNLFEEKFFLDNENDPRPAAAAWQFPNALSQKK